MIEFVSFACSQNFNIVILHVCMHSKIISQVSTTTCEPKIISQVSTTYTKKKQKWISGKETANNSVLDYYYSHNSTFVQL